MTLKHTPSRHLDNLSAIEVILARFEDDVVRQQELSAWLHELVALAEGAMDDGDYDCPVEDLFYPEEGTHYCDPTCEGGCADVRRQTVATRKVTFPVPGGASLVT